MTVDAVAPAPTTLTTLDPAVLRPRPVGARLSRATPADLGCVRDLHRVAMRPSLEAVLGPWDDAAQARWFTTHVGPATTWLVRQDATVIGSLSWHDRGDHDYLELFQLHPAHQRQHLGGTILLAVTRAADARGRTLALSVMRGSDATRLYLRHGFVVTHEDALQLHLRRAPQPAAATIRDRLTQVIGQHVDVSSTVDGRTVGGEGFVHHAWIDADGEVWVEVDWGMAWRVRAQDFVITPRPADGPPMRPPVS